MANENETIADIIAEMRFHGQQNIDAEKDKPEYGILTVEGEIAQNYADRLEAALKREKAAIEADALAVGGYVAATAEKSSAVGNAAKLPKTVDLRFDICRDIALVLKIGRDYQNKDGYRGAHYDTVKLLCDAIEYQQEQLKTKTEVGDCAKLREALKLCSRGMCGYCIMDAEARGLTTECVNGCEALRKAKAALVAPARNCDRFASAEEAWDAYDEWVESYRSKGKTEPFNEFGWLFAPAQEGGAK